MSDQRILFRKAGTAKYISHLDLMHTMERAFLRAGIAILKAAGLRKGGVKFVSCPTCGRTEIDLIGLASQVEERVRNLNRDITVAVMGCVVNGPGEAREADYGIAGGKDKGLLFKKGQVLGTYDYDQLCDKLMELIMSEK